MDKVILLTDKFDKSKVYTYSSLKNIILSIIADEYCILNKDYELYVPTLEKVENELKKDKYCMFFSPVLGSRRWLIEIVNPIEMKEIKGFIFHGG